MYCAMGVYSKQRSYEMNIISQTVISRVEITQYPRPPPQVVLH